MVDLEDSWFPFLTFGQDLAGKTLDRDSPKDPALRPTSRTAGESVLWAERVFVSFPVGLSFAAANGFLIREMTGHVVGEDK